MMSFGCSDAHVHSCISSIVFDWSFNVAISPFICSVGQEKLTLTDMGILMTAAVCHDLDHPGYNNT